MKLWLIPVFSLLLCGCAVHKPVKGNLPDMDISPESIVGDVHMEQCDISKEPPQCKRVKMKYRKGSERVVIRK